MGKGSSDRVRKFEDFNKGHEKTYGKKKRKPQTGRRKYVFGVDPALGPDQTSVVLVEVPR